mgnify:CR=1 FL=1
MKKKKKKLKKKCDGTPKIIFNKILVERKTESSKKKNDKEFDKKKIQL